MKRRLIVFCLAAIVFVPIILIALFDGSFFQGESANIGQNSLVDPCWFMSAKGFESVPETVMKSRQDREMYGYPEDISLEKALLIFNEEEKCFQGPNIPLTENELLASLGTSPDYGSEDLFGVQKDKLSKILSKGVLPKGSLLVRELSGKMTRVEGEDFYKVDDYKTIDRVYLFFDLDKKTRLEIVDRSQIILIRKHYIGR
jgi:hypothetical protein